ARAGEVGRRDAPPAFGRGARVPRRPRLLEPEGLEGPQRPSHSHGVHGRQAPMNLDEQIDLRAHRVPHGANRLHHLLLGLAGDVRAPRPGKRIELERGEAARHRLLRLRRVGVRRLRARVPAVRVDADALAARPAQEAHHRHAEPLAGEIPERLLEPAHRAPEIHGAALARKVVVGPVCEVADLSGVAAHEIARELPDVRDDRLVAIGLRVALAPADESVGRLDLYEEPVLPIARMNDERRDARDLHARPPPWLPSIGELDAGTPRAKWRLAAPWAITYAAPARTRGHATWNTSSPWSGCS